jgi:N-acetylglucosamine-1-phosphodiester alpha-N-acetylglucosaminidase
MWKVKQKKCLIVFRGLFPVRETSIQNKCKYATNGGFFNTHTSQCFGNIVTSGKVVQSTQMTNANFGITQSGKYYVGYISKEDVERKEDPFVQLISGVIWLVKNEKSFVAEAEKVEEMKFQETGTSSFFISTRASRLAIGHDSKGNLMLLEMDGDGNHQKVLYFFN